MKKIMLLITTLMIIGYTHAQDFNKIMSAQEIDWYGLDFTKAKMIGSIGFTDPDVVCDRYIQNKWNGIIFSEPEKYDISKCTDGKEVKIHLDYILERNSVVTTDELVINSEYELNQEDIEDIIKPYPQKEGIGLVFVVESFNKLNETANIWVTFFDNRSKEIINTHKYVGKPDGFGVRNYWLRGVFEVYKQLKKDYKKWKKNFS